MPQRTLRVFVSATSQDLGHGRTAVKEELLTAGIFPATQENFGPDYRRLEDFLRLEISRCDAVICLVGFAHGACPSGSQRSFTQLEYDLAVQNDKSIFLFLAADDAAVSQTIIQTDEERELQRRHRQRVMAAGHKWEVFTDAEDLRLKVARAIQTIRDLVPRPPIYYRHLPRTPSFFVGRTRELRQLHEALARPSPAVVAVIGMGGQGKTTLVHRALLDLQVFPFAAGFWCCAYRGGYIFDMFLDDVLSYLLKGKLEKPALARPEARVELLLSLAQQQPLLLVLDGVERWLTGWNIEGGDFQEAESVRDRGGFHAGLDAFLQQASSLTNGSHVVITSRALPSALDHAARTQIPVRKPDEVDLGLEGLEPSEAVDLLVKLGVTGSTDCLAEVASVYACHPLALTILGTLSKKKWGGRLDRMAPAAVLEPQRELHRLFGEIRISLPGGQHAELFLGVVSQCLENPTLAVIAAGMPPEGLRTEYALLDQAVALADWSLIGWDSRSQTVMLHPLVKRYFGSLLGPKESRRIHERLSQFYAGRAVPAAARMLEDVAPRLLAVRHAIGAGRVEEAYDWLLSPLSEHHSMFTWLSAWGHHSCGIELMGELLAAAPAELRGHLLLARAQFHYQLARLSSAGDDVEEAIRLLEAQRDRGSREVLPDLAKALATRGSICCEAGRCIDALPDLGRAIDILERIEPTNPARLDLALVLLSRANALRGAGALSPALLDYDRACGLWEWLVSTESHWGPLTFAPALSSRALCLLDLDRVELAIADLERAVTICRGSPQDSEAPLAHALATLAAALNRAGHQDRALICATEAVEILERALDRGRTDIEYILALARLIRAEIQLSSRQWEDALRDADGAVRVYQRLVLQTGPHFEAALAHAQCIRGSARYQLGDREAAENDRRTGFGIWRRLAQQWPSESEIVIRRLRDMRQAVVYLLGALDAEGISIFEELVGEYRRVLDHPQAPESARRETSRGLTALAELLPRIATAGWPAEECQNARSLLERVESSW